VTKGKPKDKQPEVVTFIPKAGHTGNPLPGGSADVTEQQELWLLQESAEGESGIFRRSYMRIARTLGFRTDSNEPKITASGTGSVAIGGDNYGIVATGDSTINLTHKTEIRVPEGVRRREAFFDDFLKESYRQAQTNFRISTIFTSVGCLIFLCSSAVAAIQALHGHPSSVSVVSSLGGAILAGSGAAIALRADRSKKYLGEQARLIHKEIREEYRLAQAATFLDALRDSELKDRLLVTAALQRLDSDTDVSVVLQQLLRDQSSASPDIANNQEG
jgi:hypothetical protein